MHPDESFENLKKILSQYTNEQLKSESDTRCKLIDSVLINSLGWSEKNITREENNSEGYSDYILSLNSMPMIIIEAKKSGDYFDIPLTYNRRRYKINGSISVIENLMNAINQVRSYCLNTGIRFAVVTNGYQYVIFSAFSIGKKWEDTDCIIFNSKDDIISNFNMFWNILSIENVSKGSLIEHIDKGRTDIEFKKLYSEIHNRDYKWTRNKLYTYLRPICDLVFTELLDEAKMHIPAITCH